MQVAKARRSPQAILKAITSLAAGNENPANNPDFRDYQNAAINRNSFSGLIADRGPVSQEFNLGLATLSLKAAYSPEQMLKFLKEAGNQGLSFKIGGRLADFGSSLDWWNSYLKTIPTLRPFNMTCSTVVASDPEKCGVQFVFRSLESAIEDSRIKFEILNAKNCLGQGDANFNGKGLVYICPGYSSKASFCPENINESILKNSSGKLSFSNWLFSRCHQLGLKDGLCIECIADPLVYAGGLEGSNAATLSVLASLARLAGMRCNFGALMVEELAQENILMGNITGGQGTSACVASVLGSPLVTAMFLAGKNGNTSNLANREFQFGIDGKSGKHGYVIQPLEIAQAQLEKALGNAYLIMPPKHFRNREAVSARVSSGCNAQWQSAMESNPEICETVVTSLCAAHSIAFEALLLGDSRVCMALQTFQLKLRLLKSEYFCAAVDRGADLIPLSDQFGMELIDIVLASGGCAFPTGGAGVGCPIYVQFPLEVEAEAVFDRLGIQKYDPLFAEEVVRGAGGELKGYIRILDFASRKPFNCWGDAWDKVGLLNYIDPMPKVRVDCFSKELVMQ